MNFTMEGVVENLSPSMAVAADHPSPWYESTIAKDIIITVVTTVTSGITAFLLTKLWKCIKAKPNTSAAPPPNQPQEQSTTPPTRPYI
jgi:hypothetical protein